MARDSRRRVGRLSRGFPGWFAIIFGIVAAPSTGRLQADDGRGSPLPPRALARIGTDDLRTRGYIPAIAFSPDGRRVAAGHTLAPGVGVAVFDVRTGKRVKQIAVPGGERRSVHSVAFSPDGTRLLWGEARGGVALWDLAGDRLLFRETLHPGVVNDVAFSPDGRLMASAGGDVIRLRRVERPAEAGRDFIARPDPVAGNALVPAGAAPGPAGAVGFGCLAFTPDGTRIVGGTDYDAAIFVWRVEDGRLLRKIVGAHGQSGSGDNVNPRLNVVAVTPDGRRIMSVGQTTELIERTKLKYGSKDVMMSEVRFWDIGTGERLADYRGGEETGFGYGALSRDGRRIAVGDFGRLRILDAATGRAEQTIELPGSWGKPPAFSPDGAIVAMPIDNAVGLFDVATGRRLHHEPSTPIGYPESVAWSPAGDRIVVGQRDGYVRVWDVASGRLIWHKVLAPVISRSGWNARPSFVAFSRDGRLVVAAGRRDDPIRYENGIVAIYEADTGRVVREVVQQRIRWAALAPDDRMIVVATSHGSLTDSHFIGVEIATGRTRWINPPADQRRAFYHPAGLQFEPKPPWFVAALADGNVIRFNALTGHEQRRFLADWRTDEQKRARNPRSPGMLEAAFGADGRTLVTSRMGWLYLWDVESGAMRRKFPDPHRYGSHLALAPDGRTLAASDLHYADGAGEDTIRVYDVEAGRQVLTLEPGDDRAVVMGFSPDGTRLAAGLNRGPVILWDIRR